MAFIKLDKEVIYSAIFQKADMLRLWIYLLCAASFEEKDVISYDTLVHLQKGELLTCRKKLAEILSLDESKVYRMLKSLSKLGYISLEPHGKYTIIALTCDEKNDGMRTAGEQQTNESRTADERELNTNIEIKNKRNKEIENRESAHARKPFGRYNNVFLSEEEYQSVKESYSNYDALIERLSKYMTDSGRSYASHYDTIMEWARTDGEAYSQSSFDPDEFFEAALRSTVRAERA